MTNNIEAILLSSFIKKNRTKSDHLCKHRFLLIRDINDQDVIVCFKRILVNQDDIIRGDLVRHGFKLIKSYKEKMLFEKPFSIKMSTFLDMNSWITDTYQKLSSNTKKQIIYGSKNGQ